MENRIKRSKSELIEENRRLEDEVQKLREQLEKNYTGDVAPNDFVSQHPQVGPDLAIHHERFNQAMEASSDGLFDWNLETNEIYYSPAWKQILGYEDDALANDFSVWESLTHPEDVKRSWEMQQNLVAGKIDRFEIEFRMKHRDGQWREILSRAKAIFDENGNAIRMIGTHVDITERKAAERALKISESRFKRLFENRLPVCIISPDIKKLNIPVYTVSTLPDPFTNP